MKLRYATLSVVEGGPCLIIGLEFEEAGPAVINVRLAVHGDMLLLRVTNERREVVGGFIPGFKGLAGWLAEAARRRSMPVIIERYYRDGGGERKDAYMKIVALEEQFVQAFTKCGNP